MSDAEPVLHQPVERTVIQPATPELIEAARHEFQRTDLVAADPAWTPNGELLTY